MVKNYSPVVLVAEPLPLLAEFYKGQVRAGGEQGCVLPALTGATVRHVL